MKITSPVTETLVPSSLLFLLLVILSLYKKTGNNQDNHSVTWDMATSKDHHTIKDAFPHACQLIQH